MGRFGIAESQVFQAANQLSVDGVRPTVDAVRIALGNTGSRTTINKYLKMWRERKSYRDADTTASIDDDLRRVIASQAELLLTLAAESKAKLLENSTAFEATLGAQRVLNQQLEITLSECRTQLTELQEAYEQKNLEQLRLSAVLADLREQNEAYREALAKEICRREVRDLAIADYKSQLVALQKELKATSGL